jgi:hypothetical protein
MSALRVVSSGLPLVIALSAGLAGPLVQTAWAQERKPLPPPPAPEVVGSERLASMAEFLESYRRAGSPRLLISTDVIPASAGGAGASRAVTMGETLGARMEDLFRDPEVTIINAQAQGLLGAQQREAMRGNDEVAAARILGRDAGADVIMSLVLTEKPERGRFSGRYVITDLRQGTNLGTYAFDMLPDPQTGELDNYRLSEYARAIAGRMSRQMTEAFPGSPGGGSFRRYTLRVVGDYTEDDLVALRDALNMSEGVRQGSVVMRGEERSSATLVTTLDMLSNQDLLGVRQSLRRAVTDQLVMGSEVLDVKGTTINMRLEPLGMSDRERALSGGSASGRNRGEREAFAAAYAKANRPTIAVLIHRAEAWDTQEPISIQQPAGAVPSSGDAVNVIVGDRVQLGGGVGSGLGTGWVDPITKTVVEQELRDQREERLEQRELDVRSIENRMIERLGILGLNLKDVSIAQAEMTKSGELAGKAWTDRELGSVLGAKAQADIVLSGVAKTTRTRAGGFPMRIELTVRAYRLSDGVIVGAATTSREVTSAGATLEQALDAMSAEATGRLASQMADRWK